MVKHEKLAIGHHARTSQLTALQYLRVGCSQWAVDSSRAQHSSAARLQALVRQILARDAVRAMANRHVEAHAADVLQRYGAKMQLRAMVAGAIQRKQSKSALAFAQWKTLDRLGQVVKSHQRRAVADREDALSWAIQAMQQQVADSLRHTKQSVKLSVEQHPSTLTLGHGTAPLQSGVVQQEAGQAELTSVAYGSIEQCDRALLPPQSGIALSGPRHTPQHTARLITTARDLIRDRSGGSPVAQDHAPSVGDGHTPQDTDLGVSPLRCPEKGNSSPRGALTHSAHNAMHTPALGCPMGSITGGSDTQPWQRSPNIGLTGHDVQINDSGSDHHRAHVPNQLFPPTPGEAEAAHSERRRVVPTLVQPSHGCPGQARYQAKLDSMEEAYSAIGRPGEDQDLLSFSGLTEDASPTAAHQRYMAELTEQSLECGVPEQMLLEERCERLWSAGLDTSSVDAALRASVTAQSCPHQGSPVMGTPVNMSELPMASGVSIGVALHGAAPGTPTVDATVTGHAVESRDPMVMQSGESNDPITIDDSDDSDTCPSAPGLLPTVVEAQEMMHIFGCDHTHEGTEPMQWGFVREQFHSMAKHLDAALALQQVTARFPQESMMSWEARGSAMLGQHQNYATTMMERIRSPYQQNGVWRDHAMAYAQMLALLQLDVKQMQQLWPATSGGEVAFRRKEGYRIKTWLAFGRLHSWELETTAAHKPEAAAQVRSETGPTASLE